MSLVAPYAFLLLAVSALAAPVVHLEHEAEVLPFTTIALPPAASVAPLPGTANIISISVATATVEAAPQDTLSASSSVVAIAPGISFTFGTPASGGVLIEEPKAPHVKRQFKNFNPFAPFGGGGNSNGGGGPPSRTCLGCNIPFLKEQPDKDKPAVAAPPAKQGLTSEQITGTQPDEPVPSQAKPTAPSNIAAHG